MRLSRAMLVGFLSLLLVLGCSKDKDKIVVAKVGDRMITLARFENSYRNVNPRFLPEKGGFEGYREFLETMIRKEIMEIKADELGYDRDPTVVQGMDAFKRFGLQAGYLKIKAADKVKVTEKDLRDYYEKYNTTLSIKQILVDTEEEAEEVYQLLKDGNDFESVCKEYSKSQDADKGGSVLSVRFGTLSPDFQYELFSLPVGSISEPLESPYGYFIVKVLRKGMGRKASFKEMKPELKKTVRSFKELMMTSKLGEDLRKKAGVKWYMNNIKIVFEAMPPDPSLRNLPDAKSEEEPVLHFDEQDLDKPLVTYKDKAITIKEFSDLYEKTPILARPRKEFRLAGVKHFLMRKIMNELVLEEIESSGIENEPEVKQMLDNKRNQMMINRMYSDLISSQVMIREAEIKNYYDNNIERFRVPERRRFGVILTGDRSSALEAYEKIMEGEDFADIVAAYSIDENTLENRGETDLLTEGSQPEIDKVGFNLEKVGQVSEPFQMARGWMVLKLIEKQAERILPYDEARPYAERDLKDLKTDERLNELIEEWKKDIVIEVYEKNLRKANVRERTREAG